MMLANSRPYPVCILWFVWLDTVFFNGTVFVVNCVGELSDPVGSAVCRYYKVTLLYGYQ